MATTLDRTGVTLTNDTGTPASPVGDGTVLNNAWVQTFMNSIDALLTGATFNFSGLLDADGFGEHLMTTGGTGGNILRIQNTTAGTTNYAEFRIGHDSSNTSGRVRHTASNFTASAPYAQDAMHLVGERAGGVVIAATNASGPIVFYAGGGTTIRGRFLTAGQFALNRTAITGLFGEQLSVGGNTMMYGASGVYAAMLWDDTGSSEDGFAMQAAQATGAFNLFSVAGGALTTRLQVTSSGHLHPGADLAYNCGGTSARWLAVNALTVNAGDVVLDNGFRITEHDKIGLTTPGVGIVSADGLLVAFFARDGSIYGSVLPLSEVS